jgi:hypothetical protein
MDDQFEILLERHLGGDLDAEGLDEFERILLSDRRARAAFWRAVKLDAALGRMGGEEWGRLLAERSGRDRRRRLSPAWAVAAAAVVAVTALGVRLARPPGPADDGALVERVGPLVMPDLAVLREADAAVAADGREFRIGETIGPGILDLQTGSVLVTLFSGTRVGLDGPARLELADDSSVVLLAGALRAEVPAVADRFLLELPGVRIEAGAARLAARVAADGTAGLRISAGEVVAGAGGGAGRRLGPGDYTIAADGTISSGEEPAAEVESPFPATPAASPGERRQLAFQKWHQASDARVGDDSLLFYLRFVAAEEALTGILRNEGGHAAGSSEALLISGSWVEGRWPGKRALLLQSAADRVRFRVDGSHARLTFSAWIQPWNFGSPLNALIMSQWGVPGEVHWQFSQAGDLRFGVRPVTLRSGGLFHRVFADELLPPGQRGRWHHLVTTYDAEARVVVHYLNGREVKRDTLPERVPLAFGQATMGNATSPPPDVWGPRPFGGAVDELAIYARVLSPDEILGLHQEGSPDRLPEK